MNIPNLVRDYIVKSLAVGIMETDLEDHDSLLEKGILNSTGVLELIDFLEQQFGITCADDEVTPQNLDSLASITSYVQRKMLA